MFAIFLIVIRLVSGDWHLYSSWYASLALHHVIISGIQLNHVQLYML